MGLGQFVRFVSDQTGVSIIVDEQIDGHPVFAEIRNQPVGEVLSGVARRLGVSLREHGGIYLLGTTRPEDRGVLVRRVRRLRQADLQSALDIFAGENGRSVAFADGLVVVGDKVEVLINVAQMLDDVEAAEVPVWVIELHLVGWSRRAAEDCGFDLTPAADLAFGFAVGSSGASLDFDLAGGLDGILRIASERSDVRVSSAPMFVLLDGSQGRVVQGDRVPIPRRSTSDQGTTVTEGFDFVQTGTDVSVTLREVAIGKARIDVAVSMSDIRSFVEVAPVTGEETFQTTAMVEAGGVYLLGSIVKDRESGDDAIGWRTNDAWTREVQVVQVWCRCYRIGGSLSDKVIHSKAQATRGLLQELEPVEEEAIIEPAPLSPVEGDASQAEPRPVLSSTVYRVEG